MSELPALVRVFAYLSLLTIGGGLAVRNTENALRWLDGRHLDLKAKAN